MSLFRFGKKKKKNQSCGDVVGSPDMWAAANGIGMQAPYETARTFGGCCTEEYGGDDRANFAAGSKPVWRNGTANGTGL